jgi:acetyl esterase/lipase
MKKITILTLIVTLFCLLINAQEFQIPLYSGIIPNAKSVKIVETTEYADFKIVKNVTNPDISVYLPTRKFETGKCVIICPGGGYGQLSVDLEGSDIARFLNSIGVAAVVLKYRLPTKENSIDPSITPLLDAQRAIRLVRFNAHRWGIHPNQIGIMGFSAGGHLASTASTHFDYGKPTAKDSVEQQSCRPDFTILGYPVVSFGDSVKQTRTKNMLFGDSKDWKQISKFSNELQVTKETPPAFIIHADNDPGVVTMHSILYYNALHKNGIPCELHILSEGGHGFGLGTNNPHVNVWTYNLKLWLASLQLNK